MIRLHIMRMNSNIKAGIHPQSYPQDECIVCG